MQTQTNLHPKNAVDAITDSGYNDRPRVGLITGSGLGQLVDCITDQHVIPYHQLPGFAKGHVEGHDNQLVLGNIGKTPVACLQGRLHVYEGSNYHHMKHRIRTLKLLGCQTLLLTNAAGSLREDVKPGDLMLITDHINMQPGNPLIGQNDDEFGPRFFSMDQAYDHDHLTELQRAAKTQNIPLATGVYIATAGPNFETPAEIRAFRTMGADAVGMSTVPDVLIARHCDLRVACVSTMTNFAAGMSDEILSHEGTLRVAKLGAEKLTRLIVEFISAME